MLYEFTMESDETENPYSDGVFSAPNDEAAIKFASTWPTLNGWPSGTKWTCARHYVLTISETGEVMYGAATLGIGEGHT